MAVATHLFGSGLFLLEECFLCRECGEYFTRIYGPCYHQRVPTGEFGKSFTTSIALHYHQRVFTV